MNITAPMPISATDILEQTSARPTSMAALTEKFAGLMNRASEVSPTQSSEPSTLATVLLNQDESMRKNIHEVHELAETFGSVSPEDRDQKVLELTYKLASTHFQFNACALVSQGCKNGLQTLMRNQ